MIYITLLLPVMHNKLAMGALIQLQWEVGEVQLR